MGKYGPRPKLTALKILSRAIWVLVDSTLGLNRRVREQERGQRGAKVYSLHAPEVECIGKGKALSLIHI